MISRACLISSVIVLAFSFSVGAAKSDSASADQKKGNAMTGKDKKMELVTQHISMEEVERKHFAPGPGPLDSKSEQVRLRKGAGSLPPAPAVLSLDGTWQMIGEGSDGERLFGPWTDAIPSQIPGSVHTALVMAGRIPDPTVGRNDAIAREQSFKTWWFKKTFRIPKDLAHPRLVFGGVAVRCTIYLNGQYLGDHDGMFGEITFDLSGRVKEENTLVVRIAPAPYREGKGEKGVLNEFFNGMNIGWVDTVVFNNVYGWHYSNIPSIGIWRPVRIEGQPTVKMDHPFVATRDAHRGTLDLVTRLDGPAGGFSGKLIGTISPDNFEGKDYHFERLVASEQASEEVHLQLTIPEARLWWPNGIGPQNLYKMTLAFVPRKQGVPDCRELTFGIRTIRMAPTSEGPRSDLYNWTFVINDRPTFIKGTGWCTMDPLMDFSRERYKRLFDLARDQHIQMFRAWGSGMPETDEFYDLANRTGIMVLQEWPTAWSSHKCQPFKLLEETVRQNMMRLRNHPSLAMWCGGNEDDDPYGPAIDMMGRYAYELDGTRVFHRTDPFGGSKHDYSTDWGLKPLDENLHLKALFFGEFGMRSMPVLESVMRYLPEAERNIWPPSEEGSFAYHQPVFNTKNCMNIIRQEAGYFSACATMADFVRASQVASATVVRSTLELARTRWPDCTGALYYKMNDNYPAASWACVDWYGAPKISHYLVQDTFSPLHAALLLPTFDAKGKALNVPVVLLDDADELKGTGWSVNVRAYNGILKKIAERTWNGSGAIERVKHLDTFTLSAEQTATAPLFLVAEILRSGKLEQRSYYWANFYDPKDCLFDIPKTTLARSTNGKQVTVTNTGGVPAIGVHIDRPGHMETFHVSDGYMWIEPGESQTVEVNEIEGLVIGAWNAAGGK